MKYPEPPLVQNRGAGSHNYLLTLSSASLACDLGENDRTPPVGIPLVDIRKALRTVPVSHMYSTKHYTRVLAIIITCSVSSYTLHMPSLFSLERVL